MIDPNEEFYTVDDLAELLKVHRNTLLVMLRSGEITSIKIGARYRVYKSQLQQFFEDASTNGHQW